LPRAASAGVGAQGRVDKSIVPMNDGLKVIEYVINSVKYYKDGCLYGIFQDDTCPPLGTTYRVRIVKDSGDE
jgi:hypothetical protein